jgi:hypothetical protein
VGAREIQAIQADLRRQLGAGHETSTSYIAEVLRQAGVRVELSGPYTRPQMAEPYASRLDGLLEFADLEKAESSLRKLDEVYREYQSASDRVGSNLVRSIVILGKQRARSMARNPRLSQEKRREKEEIAEWFKLWLELPSAFFDWLDLRQRSEEFQKMFPGRKTGDNPTDGE